jgi:very-short-patch-repair endonuclease
MDVRLRELAAAQADIIAAWQLLAGGWTRRMVDHHARHHGWRPVHRGVFALTHAPLTRRQRWIAATLTTRHSVLSHASAGACFGFRPWEGRYEVVTRPGSGGPERFGGLLVCRSNCLDGDTTRYDGTRITTAARTLIDLAAQLDEKAIKRMFREALRLKVTTRAQLLATLYRHRGRRGTRLLLELTTRYGQLPYARTRSDAEALAIELLHDAGIEPPRVNMRIAGEEADLVWPDRRRIIELDGPQYHRFPEEDARKQAAWEGAGYTVRRLPTDAVYDQPSRLITLAKR